MGSILASGNRREHFEARSPAGRPVCGFDSEAAARAWLAARAGNPRCCALPLFRVITIEEEI